METKPDLVLDCAGHAPSALAGVPPSKAPSRPMPPVRGGAPVRAMPQGVAPVAKSVIKIGKVQRSNVGHRIVLYGPGGIGKTTLACAMPGPVGYVDLEKSFGVLYPRLESLGLVDNFDPIEGISNWMELRTALQSEGWDSFKTIVIDTGTKAEEFALAWMFANIKEKGVSVCRIEDYGYKSGYRHLFDTFNLLLGDLDEHVRAGRNVVLVCHDGAAKVPNPQGADWIRWEPRLAQDDKNCQLRYRVKEWADHVLAFLYDVNVSKDGKGQGSGTRTIYTYELPHCMAKSRTSHSVIPVNEGEERSFWTHIFGE